MKHKMDKTEKIRRQAWRDQLAGIKAPLRASVTRLRQHTPKALRVAHIESKKRTLESHATEPHVVLADLFRGMTYRGPYKRVTNRMAFLNRLAKRASQAIKDLQEVL